LSRALREGGWVAVRRLLEMDWQDFVASGDLPLHYAESAMLIRFLLAPETGYATGFREFLAGVSRGEPATSEALYRHLGVGGESLDARYRAWLGLRLGGRL
ncbi:MAG: hypothetical protein KDD47_01800, partial [Acidobacteria bacterium]|nr:hypothetical protein [Acidobacteriota bacterium]